MLVPLALTCAALAVPYLFTHGAPAVAMALQHGFALVCHQRPERSFWLFGTEVGVCARCLGIYLGAALGLMFSTSRLFALRWLATAVVINFLDFVSESAALHGNWLAVRFGLGLLLGGAAGLLLSSSPGPQSRICADASSELFPEPSKADPSLRS
jgi:uncharacterized membrane protein